MERIRKSILMTIFMLLIGVSFNVKAETFNYYLSNSEQNYEYVDKNNNKAITIQRGDKIKVVAIVDNKDNVSNYRLNNGKLTIRWDEKYLELQELNGKYYNDNNTDIEGLTIGSSNHGSNKFSINNISSTGFLKPGKNKIVELEFVVLNNATAGETKIYQMDGEDSLKCLDSEEQDVNCGDSSYSEIKYTLAKSTINTLSMVKINGYELELFSEDRNEYDIQVEADVEKVNIEVTKKDSKSVISGNYGENPVKYGLNKFEVNVISESGERNTYKFNITREDLRSNDNSLRTLTISSGEFDFKPELTDYIINVENEIDKITITSSLNDSKSKYVEDFQNKEIELKEGSNKVEIKIISEKGEERVYTLNINRALSSNNSLKSIKINGEKMPLKDNEFIYNIEVENSVEEVIIKAEANDPKATVDLKDKYPLEVGDNEISITVKAASGKEATYIINIIRAKLLSKDSLLTSIKIEGYDIDFKQNVTTYDLKINDSDEELNITTTQEDPNATVVIEGNKDLIDGSIIKINVKAEDGTFTRYFIRIEKGSSGISPIIIIIGVLFLLLVGCIGIIFFLKKKKEKAKFDKLDEEKEKAKEEHMVEEEVNKSNDDEEVKEEIPEEETITQEEETNIIGKHEKVDQRAEVEEPPVKEEQREEVIEENSLPTDEEVESELVDNLESVSKTINDDKEFSKKVSDYMEEKNKDVE